MIVQETDSELLDKLRKVCKSSNTSEQKDAAFAYSTLVIRLIRKRYAKVRPAQCEALLDEIRHIRLSMITSVNQTEHHLNHI